MQYLYKKEQKYKFCYLICFFFCEMDKQVKKAKQLKKTLSYAFTSFAFTKRGVKVSVRYNEEAFGVSV